MVIDRTLIKSIFLQKFVTVRSIGPPPIVTNPYSRSDGRFIQHKNMVFSTIVMASVMIFRT